MTISTTPAIRLQISNNVCDDTKHPLTRQVMNRHSLSDLASVSRNGKQRLQDGIKHLLKKLRSADWIPGNKAD